ncbi:MAG: hypothetical protein IT326_00880 [Anaerolineae bacterium]|nr:hypothetical protein [Anaerolineae bacterium]
MDYQSLLRRAWDIVWNNKHLIALGVIVALLSGGNGGGGGSGFRGSGDFDGFNQEGETERMPDLPENFPDLEALRDESAVPIIAAVIIALLCVAIVIGLVFLYIASVANGGLIGGVNAIESGRQSSFGIAWGMGWEKGVTLFLIALVQAIPGLTFLLVILGVGIGFVMNLDSLENLSPEMIFAQYTGLVIVVIALGCLVGLVSLVLEALKLFADRSAMLKGTGVFESYSGGWATLRAHIGEALVVFLIQIGIQIVLGLLMIVPGIIMALCCLLWPVLIAISGLIESYFSTVWTLAYRRWTGMEDAPKGEPIPSEPVPPEPLPAV